MVALGPSHISYIYMYSSLPCVPVCFETWNSNVRRGEYCVWCVRVKIEDSGIPETYPATLS